MHHRSIHHRGARCAIRLRSPGFSDQRRSAQRPMYKTGRPRGRWMDVPRLRFAMVRSLTLRTCAPRVWGAPVQLLEKLRKLDARSRICFFVGYKYEGGGYRVWDPRKGVVVESRDVVFKEDGLPPPTGPQRVAPAVGRRGRAGCTACTDLQAWQRCRSVSMGESTRSRTKRSLKCNHGPAQTNNRN